MNTDVASSTQESSQENIELFRNTGYCHSCRSDTEFVAYGSWLRDYYVCGQCMSIPRQRHIQYILDSFFPEWENKQIHESSPSNDMIARHCSNYSASQYLVNVAPGHTHEGIRCEDLQALTFDDGSFDIFITQDVLEHVFDPERASQEIMRVLKPGGIHIFTTPKHQGLAQTLQRARREADGTITHILPDEYHGNPVGDGKALVTFDFGNDFEQLLSAWTHRSVQVFHTKDRTKGIDAAFNEVFVIKA